MPYTPLDDHDSQPCQKRTKDIGRSNFTRLLGIVRDELLNQFQGRHCKSYHIARPIPSQPSVQVPA